MATMDEYIDQLLAEMQMPEPAQKVVRNILDEPIPETVKRCLLKPLFPKNLDGRTAPRTAPMDTFRSGGGGGRGGGR